MAHDPLRPPGPPLPLPGGQSTPPGPEGPPSPHSWVPETHHGPEDSGSLATLGLDSGAEKIREFLLTYRSENTRRAYAHHWRSWQGWCRRTGRVALPAEPRSIVEWLAGSTWGLSKIEGVAAAIAHAHRLAGYDPPPTSHALVRMAMSAARRQRGGRPTRAKAPVTLDELPSLLAQLDRATLAGKRDAALLLVAWWSAMRRSELVEILVEDVDKVPGGVALRIRRSKTDQAGKGAIVGLEEKGGPLCPVEALRTWLDASGIKSGPVFRGFKRNGELRAHAVNAQEVARLVQRLAASAGLDAKRFGGHSTRAGHVTEAYRQNVPEAQIMATTRHKSVAMLARYRREADPVKSGSSSRIHVPDEE